MPQQEAKKPIAVASKALLIVVIIEAVIIMILIFSGFKKISVFVIYYMAAGAAVIGFIYWKRHRQADLYSLIEDVAQRHYAKTGYALDVDDAYAVPVAADIVNIYFPNEGLTFEIRNQMVMGILPRHLYKVVREQEKSRLFDTTQKILSGKSQLKQQAELLGVDIGSLGLE